MDGVFDQFAKFERAKTAERTRRGRLRKAREGKLLAGSAPNFGFKFNASRDGYEVDEDAMRIVRRIFHMVGVEGKTLYEVASVLRKEGIPTPGGKKVWPHTFVRTVVNNDVYKRHAFEEVEDLVRPEVASTLDPEKRYGIWWYNRTRITRKQEMENGPEGRIYRLKKTTVHKPLSERIAVPVPDSGIPRGWVDAARMAIKDNRKPSFNGQRFWELSSGIAWCGLCGARMETNTVNPRGGRKYFYYRCWRRNRFGDEACPRPSNHPACRIEPLVWEFVSTLLRDPERLRVGLEQTIEEERKGLGGDPEGETRAWLEKLTKAEHKRSSFQDMAAEGLITFDELREKLAAIEETCETARRELEALSRRQKKIEELEYDRDALLESYASLMPEALDALTAEEHHRVYKMLRLRVVLRPDEPPEVSGTFREGLSKVSELETASRPRSAGSL